MTPDTLCEREDMNESVVHIRYRKLEPLKVGNKIFKPVYDTELTEKELEKAARELGETEERKKVCLRKLKEKLLSEPNIKYRLDDFYLLRFLRVRKYDVKKAYQNVKLLFQERKKHKKIFTIPPDFKSIVQLNWFTILPYADEEGRILFWLNFKKWNSEKRSFEEILQASAAMLDLISMIPRCQVNGTVDVWNMEGLTMRDISEMLRDGRLWTCLSVVQNGYPFRCKKLIILNTNRFVRYLYNLARPLLKKKIAERIVLLGSDLNELHKHVNPALLPKSLKGTLEDKECEVSQHILDNMQYLKYERSFMFE